MRVHPAAIARGAVILVAALALFSTGACTGYTSRSVEIRAALDDGDYNRAMKVVDELDSSTSRLLYYYGKGQILHTQGLYQESNDAFDEAELLLEDLYTKSVTREIASLAVNDAVRAYRGDPFEAVFVNYYQLFNYLHLGDLDGAIVECRQLSRKLQLIRDSDEDSYFENDPFLQYLTAMLYELSGERTEAEVSFRVAVEAYESLADRYQVDVPSSLYCDAAANARVLGDSEESDRYSEGRNCGEGRADRSSTGRLNLFLESGYVAHKVEANIVLPIFKDDAWDDDDEFAHELAGRHHAGVPEHRKVDYWLRVALPTLPLTPVEYSQAVVTAVRVDSSGVVVDDGEVGEVATTTVVENLDALAQIAFDEKQASVFLRAIVRALIKYGAKRAADNEDEALGALVNLLGVATESADTRSWSILPGQVLMTRIELPEGRYDLHVDLYDPAGTSTGTMTIYGIAFVPGKTEFLNFRVQ